MKNEIYVVTAYRWGERENHSYVIGVFDKKHAAIKAAESHTTYRGGKYSCFVEKCVMNAFKDDADNYTSDVYKSKGISLK